MGMPPQLIIERLNDPAGPYDYVVYCGWRDVASGYDIRQTWTKHFEDNYGTDGLDFGGPWFYSTYFNKLYFKEKDYPFFMMKYGEYFNKRPWEI